MRVRVGSGLCREEDMQQERKLGDPAAPGDARAAITAWPDDRPAKAALARLDFESYRAELSRLVAELEAREDDPFAALALFLYDQLRTLADATAVDSAARDAERRRHYWFQLLGSATDRQSLLQSFLAEVDRSLAPFRAAQRAVNPIVLRARRFIEEHAAEPVSLSRVSTELRVARNYLSALFKRETGITLTEYIHQVRIRRAEILLRSGDLTLAEAAYRVGYQSYRHFYRNFVRICGLSPTIYVRRLGEPQREPGLGTRRNAATSPEGTAARGRSAGLAE